jgi:eukaryotic-like serine/threonine-protein kinase
MPDLAAWGPADESSCSSLEQDQRVDRLCNRFEDAWQAGNRPKIDDYLAEASCGERHELLRELLTIDLHYRRTRGETPALDEYRAEHPALDFECLADLFAPARSSNTSILTQVAAQPTVYGSHATAGDGSCIRRVGDYELLEEIARGGMGVVYRARQISLGRTVAVKMILAGNLATKADHERFHCEAQAAALLDHPNILPVFEVGEQAGQHFFSMSYVEGQSLAARLSEGPLPPDEAAELVATVAEAIEYAHRQGVIHRDIKPSNILLDSEDRPRVTDFGLAKRLGGGSELTTTGQILGTPSYMAPEQATGQVVGPAADVYSLGALLYAALTGRPPFQAATPLETMQQVLSREPVVLRQLNAAVPRDLETIVLKCLEKPATQRYATAQALADDLRRYLARRPIVARPAGRCERTWRWCRRQPFVAGLAAAVAVSIVAGIVASSLFAADAYRKAKLAQENAEKLKIAEAAAQRELAQALLAQARLASHSHEPGQRFDTLAAIGKVRQIEGPSRKLADEAVAALCMADLVVDRHWPGAPQGFYTGAFSPRLDLYAGCDMEGNISVRRVDGDVPIAAFKTGHRVSPYGGMEFSPDGRYLRATTGDAAVGSRLYRIDIAPATTILDDHHICLAFSPDSTRFIARYAGNEYRLCELPSGKELRRYTFPGVIDDQWGVLWNPRRPQVAIVCRTSWRIADLETGKQQAECPVPGRIGNWLWHPDGRHLAVSTELPPAVGIYDTVSRRIVARRCTGGVGAGVVPAFNHAGGLLVTNDWSGVRRLWDPASGTELLHMSAADRNFFVVSPDDHHAAFNVEGGDLQTLRIAEGAERTFAAAPAYGGAANDYGEQIVPSPDGRLLAVASAPGVSLLDAETGFELAVIPDREPVDFDSAGALISIGRNGAHRWPLEWTPAKRALRVGIPRELFNHIPIATSCSTNQDGTVLVMPGPIGAVVLRQAQPGGDVRRFAAGAGRQPDVRHVAVSPDGKWAAAGCYSPAPEYLANAKVWDANSGELQATLPVSEGVWVWFSPRGNWLATLSRTDGECRLWRTGSWKEGPRFPDAIEIAISRDEQILAAGSKAGRIRLYETATGREFAVLPAAVGVPVFPRAFSPDGTRLYAKVGGDSQIFVWNLRQIREGLAELGLEQGWPEFPSGPIKVLPAEPPVVEIEAAR